MVQNIDVCSSTEVIFFNTFKWKEKKYSICNNNGVIFLWGKNLSSFAGYVSEKIKSGKNIFIWQLKVNLTQNH